MSAPTTAPAGEGTKTWRLRTGSGEYAVGLAPGRRGLVLVRWGEPGGGLPEIGLPRRSTSFEDPLDLLPLEATALGTRSVHSAEIVVRRADGVRGARLEIHGEVVLEQREDGDHMVCPLADPGLGLEVELHVRTSPRHEVVEKWAVLRSTASEDLELLRAWGGAFEVPGGEGAVVELLHGAWSREYTRARTRLGAGTLSIGSRQGITSHTYAPVMTVRGGEDPELAHSAALAWSGSWRMSADAPPFTGRIRLAGGPDDESGILTLAPGGQLTTPVLTGLRVRGDADAVARQWHRYQQTLTRTTGPEHRPVVYNAWYATGFDVRVDHQLRLTEAAAEIGAEVFVVDDGWFRGRVSDRSGLGDWDVDPQKFPRGLEELIDGVRARGMRFGIWVEPEAVNPDSDLYRAHPEWVHHVQGRPLRTLRNQYMLDLGRPEVEEWAAGMLRRLLSRYDITYLKWDMNRSIEDGGCPVPGADDWSWRHTRAYYRLLEMIRAEFPHVTVEGCAGGGGRIDHEVLARTDVVWPSDETGPRDRLAVQHGFLEAFPSWAMSSWVTDEPDVLDPDPASLEFRFAVAMAGVLGIGADLLAWDGDALSRARELVALYQEARSTVFTSRVHRHGDPAGDFYAVQHTGKDAVFLLAYRRPGASGPSEFRLAGPEFEDEPPVEIRWRWGDCDAVLLPRNA
ncbi:alpha-galactosidase [Nesterenkonia sp.]|uniref:alpha-galactosidase n=1 Tax=Nesterenkonia sp. TaxID=704201 RepID=UPI0026047693|nr:alpha-galactosidase [Nesterenkonia sp.]